MRARTRGFCEPRSLAYYPTLLPYYPNMSVAVAGDDYEINASTTIMRMGIAAASISTISSFAVISTAIVFPSMIRQKLFMALIVSISFCDCLGSVALVIGFPQGTSCVFQGSFIFFFYRASWLFTVSLSYSLYSLLIFGNHMLSLLQIHLIVWSLSIIFELIVLATNNYGLNSQQQGLYPCFLEDNVHPEDAKIWFLVCFYGPLIVCSVILIFLSIQVSRKYHTTTLAPLLASAVRVLSLYPACLIAAWVTNVIIFFIFTANFEAKGLNTGKTNKQTNKLTN